MFFGVQNALWFDVHTSVWGTAFFMWFIYFMDNDNRKLSIITFLLAIGSKENMAAYVFYFVEYIFSGLVKKRLFSLQLLQLHTFFLSLKSFSPQFCLVVIHTQVNKG